MTQDEAQRAWAYAVALDDDAVFDPTKQVEAIEAWMVAADALEELGLMKIAEEARDLVGSNKILMGANTWPQLCGAWRSPWETGRIT